MLPVAMLLIAAIMQPGDLIMVQAQCQTDDGATTHAGCTIVVKSPLYTNKPVYLAQGWERSNHLADGMLVRAHVKVGSETKLVDGIQMSDGRVWADNCIYVRSSAPSAPDSPDSPRPPISATQSPPKDSQSVPKTDETTVKEPVSSRE